MADTPADPRGPYFPVTVDATVWAEEVERLTATSEARQAAQTARQTLSRRRASPGACWRRVRPRPRTARALGAA